MRLTKITLMAIRGSGVDFKRKLADALFISDRTLSRYLINNDDALTKAAAMELIRKETGLTDEEILEKDVVQKV